MITKSIAETILRELRQVSGDLRKHAQEIAALRTMADVQFARIAQMQAELDVLPGRRRRRTVRTMLEPGMARAGDNGNGSAR